MAKKKSDIAVPSWICFEGDFFYLNSEKTAQFFDVTPRTVTNWKKRGAPQPKRGWWDLKKLVEWMGIGNEETMMARKIKAETSYREAKAEREQILKNELLGKYMQIEQVEEEWAKRVTEVKSGLMALARAVAAEFADPDIRKTVEKVVNNEVIDLLEQYSRTGRYTPKVKEKATTTSLDAPRAKRVETSRTAKRKRVGRQSSRTRYKKQ